jgi:hypothetical protein
MQRAGFIRVVLGAIFLPATAVFGQGMPAKIAVISESPNPVKGEVITVRITLVDAENRPAVANKNFEIMVESRWQGGGTESSNIIVKTGDTGQTTQLTLKDAGVIEITASNKQLAKGGTIVNVRSSSPLATPTPSMATPPGGGFLNIVYFDQEGAPLPASTPSTAWTPKIKLDYYPKRPLRADKNDAATICVILPDEPAREDMLIYLSSDIGPPNPYPIKIQKGESIGKATLVADRAGAIQFWYDYSTPPARAPDVLPTIKFCAPVWGWKIVPKSPRIGLFESEEIGLQLVDSSGTAVPADEEREANLSIASGTGQFDKWSVRFDSEKGYATATFIPTSPGIIEVVGTTLYLQDQSARFIVTMSFSLLVLCAVGGTLGGLVSYLTQKPSASWARIFIGLITGFVLYWAFLFGAVHLSSFSHGFLFNPFVAMVLSIIGGWIGTNVFTIVLKPLGLQW